MRIYYGASIWGADGDTNFNLNVINHLKQYGQVLSEQLFLAEYKTGELLSMPKIHARDMNWIAQSDAMVMDVSAPSLGVGYEIREGEWLGKPILCLWKQQPKRLSAMIAGSPHPTNRTYTCLEDAIPHIDEFFKSLKAA